MTEPQTFTSATPRHALPFLFAGQAQKEFFVNEALARIDALVQPAIVSERPDPPAAPVAGESFLVAASASADFAGHEAELAHWQGGQWLFSKPVSGMTVRDLSSGQLISFDGQWRRISAPPLPAGGTIVDTETRQALAALIDALRDFGIFSSD